VTSHLTLHINIYTYIYIYISPMFQPKLYVARYNKTEKTETASLKIGVNLGLESELTKSDPAPERPACGEADVVAGPDVDPRPHDTGTLLETAAAAASVQGAGASGTGSEKSPVKEKKDPSSSSSSSSFHTVSADPGVAFWENIPWGSNFGEIDIPDVQGELATSNDDFRTRFKICYDDSYLYVLVELRAPAEVPIVAHHTDPCVLCPPIEEGVEQDHSCSDSVLKLFLDETGSTHDYVEITVNALNTVFCRRWSKPLIDGGKEHSVRAGNEGDALYWSMPKLKTATRIAEGAINEKVPNLRYVEFGILLEDINKVGHKSSWKPLRMNFARQEPGGGIWSYTPMYIWGEGEYHGVYDMHHPECWAIIDFEDHNEEEVEEEVNFLRRSAMQIYSVWLDQYIPVEQMIKERLVPNEIKLLKHNLISQFPNWELELAFPNCHYPVVYIRSDRKLTTRYAPGT